MITMGLLWHYYGFYFVVVQDWSGAWFEGNWITWMIALETKSKCMGNVVGDRCKAGIEHSKVGHGCIYGSEKIWRQSFQSTLKDQTSLCKSEDVRNVPKPPSIKFVADRGIYPPISLNDQIFKYPNNPSLSSGTHRKTPSDAGVGAVVPGTVAGAAGVEGEVPVLGAGEEVEAPGRRRILGFTGPYPPSGGFQQRRHVAFPYSLLIQIFKLLPCRHPPTTTGNGGKTLNPFFSIVPACSLVRSG